MIRVLARGACVVFLFAAPLMADWYPSDPFAPGVKAMSLGGAFVSLADDASAVHANPAGLIQLDKAVFTWQLLSQIQVQRLVDTSIRLDWEYFPLVAACFPIEDGRINAALSWTTYWRSISGKYSVHILGASASWKVLPWLSWGNTIGLAIGLTDDQTAVGLFWQTGFLAPISKRIRLGLVLRMPVSLEWDALRGDTGVSERLPFTMQAGLAWRLDKTSILSFDLEFVDVAGIRYVSDAGRANPEQPTGLFRNLHPHIGFQTLLTSIGAEFRCGLMTFTHNANNSSDSQPALTLGIGAWTSQFFRIDFALQDTLIFDIFTRTNRYERISISFEYVI
jgi:hypothetical protein